MEDKKMRRFKRAVIKEELVLLTGDFTKAVILNQLLYWSERIYDFDEYIAEEKARALEPGHFDELLTHGWITKSAEKLSEETMLGLARSNMARHIKYLVDQGWINERRNPNNSYNKCKQYRVNLLKIQADLLMLGASLDGYKTELDELIKICKNFIDKNEEKKAVPCSKIERDNGRSKTERSVSERSKIKHRKFILKQGSFKIKPGCSDVNTNLQHPLYQNNAHIKNISINNTMETTNITTEEDRGFVGGYQVGQDLIFQAQKYALDKLGITLPEFWLKKILADYPLKLFCKQIDIAIAYNGPINDLIKFLETGLKENWQPTIVFNPLERRKELSEKNKEEKYTLIYRN